MTDAYKVRENRLRRMAQRQGLILRKSRRRDWRANDYGTYTLTNMHNNALEYGQYGIIGLDEIEKYLTQGDEP